jgi:tetratricopeptide (TPR) repeat protein
VGGVGSNPGPYPASTWADTADSQARELLGLGRIDEAEQAERQGLKLAEGVIERRPNDLHALQDLYFAPDVLGLIEARKNHDAAALDWFRQAGRAAKNSARFNPSDADSWYHVSLADSGISAMLLRAGHVAEAVEIQNSATNPMPENIYIIDQWRSLAMLEAQRGNRSAAERAILEARKARDGYVAAISMPQPLRQVLAETIHDVERQVKLAFTQDAAVLEAARDGLVRIEEFGKGGENPQITNPEYIAWLNQLERRALSDAARAALRLGRFGEAETFSQALLAAPLLRTESSERMLLLQPDDLGWGRVLLAQAQLGQGRREEALKTLDPALALYRDMQAQGVNHLTFHQRFARALYDHALAQLATPEGASQRRSSLAEAAKLLNELSEEAKQLHDSKELLAWMQAEEQKSPQAGHP